jgi:biopolymer transport protein ExbD
MKSTKSRRREEDSGASIDIIPLMDVIFLLLCFFILLTLNMVYQQGIEVTLAESRTGAKSSKQVKKITVTVREDGQLLIGDQTVSEQGAIERLRTLKKNNKTLTVFVKADRQARHHRIVAAMDAIRSAKVDSVVFAVQPDS